MGEMQWANIPFPEITGRMIRGETGSGDCIRNDLQGHPILQGGTQLNSGFFWGHDFDDFGAWAF